MHCVTEDGQISHLTQICWEGVTQRHVLIPTSPAFSHSGLSDSAVLVGWKKARRAAAPPGGRRAERPCGTALPYSLAARSARPDNPERDECRANEWKHLFDLRLREMFAEPYLGDEEKIPKLIHQGWIVCWSVSSWCHSPAYLDTCGRFSCLQRSLGETGSCWHNLGGSWAVPSNSGGHVEGAPHLA